MPLVDAKYYWNQWRWVKMIKDDWPQNGEATEKD